MERSKRESRKSVKEPSHLKILEWSAKQSEAQEPGVFAIQKLAQHNVELALQLTILSDWIDEHGLEYCRCENNGDFCEFHAMLADAREALK